MSNHQNIASSNKRQRIVPQPPLLNVDSLYWCSLPNELMSSIMSLLPVKSLVRFTLVTKSWKTLIHSSDFIKNHFRSLSTDPKRRQQPRLLGRPYSGIIFRLSRPLPTLIKDQSPSPPIFDDQSFNMVRNSEIVGSSNGLICWGVNFDTGNKLCLHYLNPSTRLESMSPCFRHPPPCYDNCYTVFGFGYDHLSDTYKTVGVYCNPNAKRFEHKTMVKVYTLGLDTFWRKIQSFPALIRFSYGCDGRFGKFVSGTLNWPAAELDGTQVIVSVDLVNETCRVLSLPNVILGDFEFIEKPSLCVIGDCLSCCYEMNRHQFVLWQMKEYGVAGSWTKLLNISYQDINVGIVNPIQYTPTPIFMLDSGEVLLEVDHCIFILYNPSDNSLRYLEFDYWILFKGNTHIETLVSPFQTGG